ncbi:MAG: motility protein A [Planctomycetota bacterium]
MDIATLGGLILGMTIMLMAIMLRGPVTMFADLTSLMIVVGGSFCSVLVATPPHVMRKVVQVVRRVFFVDTQSPIPLINRLVRFGEIARRDGILALENALDDSDEEFLVHGIEMAVDGSDPEHIHRTMTTELAYVDERHKSGRKIFENLGAFAPAFGMVGTLIGLILMLRELQDVASIGPRMGVALITTFYGVILANFVFIPIAEKLESRHKEEMLLKEIIIEGVMSIQSGDNPKVVEQKLKIFLPPVMREDITRRQAAGGRVAA